MKEKDKYNEPKTFELQGAVVKVYSPILTDVERKRRMDRIAKSAERLLNSAECRVTPHPPRQSRITFPSEGKA